MRGGRFLFLSTIVFTTVVFWFIFFCGYILYNRYYQKRKNDSRYTVTHVASCACGYDSVPQHLLCQMLEVKNTDLLFFHDPKVYETRLQNFSFIKAAKVFPKIPSTLMVEYTVRKPIAYIESYKNIGIDEEGVCFYIYPFFAEKRLPRLIVGVPPSFLLETIQRQIKQQKKLALGLFLVQKFSSLATINFLRLDRVDVSFFEEKNYFRKEIICVFSMKTGADVHFYLRMHPRNCRQVMEILEKKLGSIVKKFPQGGILDTRFGRRVLFIETMFVKKE